MSVAAAVIASEAAGRPRSRGILLVPDEGAGRPRRRRLTATRIVTTLFAAAMATTAAAQSTAPADTLVEARRLRDAGDYGMAASMLVPYAANHPDDPGSARFAALMAYWSKDFATALA